MKSCLKIQTQKTKRNNKPKRPQKKRRKRCSHRPNRNLFAGRRFYSLEAFLLFLHKFIGGLIDQKLGKKACQAVYSWDSCLFSLLLRSLLGFAHLSRLVEELQQNPSLFRALGLSRCFKNSKPLTELILKLSMATAKWLFLQVLLQMRTHGLVFGKTISLDTCYLHVYGKTYEKSTLGYSSQLKRKIEGYKLWVAFSVEARLPVAFHVDSGNNSDLKHFRKVLGQATYVLGPDKIRYVLADRGFCDRKIYYWLDKVMKVKFVFRAKAGKSNAYIQKPLDAIQPESYWRMNRDCRVGYTQVEGLRESVYALYSYKDRRFKSPMHLITNDRDLMPGALKKLYLKRWRVEVYFAQEKGNMALGKFSNTKFDGICGEVAICLLAKVLERAFILLMGRRYRRFGSQDLNQRVWMHGFEFGENELKRPSTARKESLVAALQRVLALLERWEGLVPKERFSHCRPAEFDECIFELPNLSLVPNSSPVENANCNTKPSRITKPC